VLADGCRQGIIDAIEAMNEPLSRPWRSRIRRVHEASVPELGEPLVLGANQAAFFK
jgi:hypothetical protein